MDAHVEVRGWNLGEFWGAARKMYGIDMGRGTHDAFNYRSTTIEWSYVPNNELYFDRACIIT